MFRPTDSLSLGWHDAPSSSTSSNGGGRVLHSRTPSGRLDPAAMTVAGGRLSSTVTPRGVAKVMPIVSLENVKTTLYGGGPERAPNTPQRGVGGNSSMAGILSTPPSVPAQPGAIVRATGRAASGGVTNRSTLDLGDSAPAGYRAPPSPAGGRFTGLLTRSNVSMSSDIDDTPLHTGKGGFSTHRATRTSIQFGSEGGENEDTAPQRRPQSAAPHRNRSTLQLGSDDSRTVAAAAAPIVDQTDRAPAGIVAPTPAGVARPALPIARSDIFFTRAESSDTKAPVLGKQHVAPITHAEVSDGLPNCGIHRSHKNVESVGMIFPEPDRRPRTTEQTSNAPLAYSQPPLANGSMIPTLRFPGAATPARSGSNGIASVPPSTRSLDSTGAGVPSGGGSVTRRVNGNVGNASSLFHTDSMAGDLQPQRAKLEAPEIPQRIVQHLRIVRHRPADSAKNHLEWQ